MAEQKPKVYLVDGSGYIFRAYYAVSPALTNKQGFPTNALFGFTRMLVKLLNDCEDHHVVMIFDAGRETFRNKLYPEYKANRTECPEDLSVQMPFFREISSAMGLPILEMQGFEADDLIGTLTRRAKELGVETVIVSADKDLMQLVSDGVSIWDTMKDKHYGRADVVEKFGVPPEKVVEFLGLTGDSSDNIPGLSGVGPKTAVQLIEKYGDVDSIIKSADKIKNDPSIRGRAKIAEQIELDPEILRLSRRLVEIDAHVPLKLTGAAGETLVDAMDTDSFESALERKPAVQDSLHALVERFGFESLIKDLKLDLPKTAAPSTEEFVTVLRKDFPAWLDKFKTQKVFAIDLETTALDPLRAKIVGLSLCWEKDRAYYIPVGHTQKPEEQISWEEFVNATRAIIEDSAVAKVGQNLKYDIEVLARNGLALKGLHFDTMIAAYLLQPDKNDFNLTSLARDFLNRSTIEFEEVLGEAADFSAVAIDLAARYAGQDALYAWLLYEVLEPKLKEQDLGPVFEQIEVPLVPVLAAMELRGVKIDTELLAKMSTEFEARIAEIQKRIFEIAGGEFNMNSPKQLSEILFTKLGISTKGLKRTKTGTSTDSSVLEKLSDQHPLPAEILNYRMLFKLKSTYIDALPAQVSAYTGRLHSRFNQTVTSTGRLSSSEPNLQNIPIQGYEGQRIRAAFVADQGNLLVSADYSQIELRVLAHLSGDENLIHAFEAGLDIHAKTARQILGLAEDAEIDADMRRMGKTINFGVIYGMSGFRLGRELGIPVGTANQYIENYFNQFPKVRDYFAGLERDIDTVGYVTTLFGRKRQVAGIDSTGRDQGFVRRAALNAPLQGTAADIIKLAMIALEKGFAESQLPAQMIMQIHDELVIEVREEDVNAVSAIVKEAMENVVKLKVPLKVELGYGKNWQEAQS